MRGLVVGYLAWGWLLAGTWAAEPVSGMTNGPFSMFGSMRWRTMSDPKPVAYGNEVFRPGAIWQDDNGVPINAHGGGMLFHNGVYWWFGEHKVAGGLGNSAQVGVHAYSSTNLYTWKDEGIALAVSEDPSHDLAKGCIIERPKVIYNRGTHTFVMWFHYEKNGRYDTASAGVATADRPAGPYRYIGLQRPNANVSPRGGSDELMAPLSAREQEMLSKGFPKEADSRQQADVFFRRDVARGHDVRDMTLFVDDDGNAYLIHSAEQNRTLHVSRLSKDYLRLAGEFSRVLEGRLFEAPALFKQGGKYWLFGSHCSGWAPNAGRLAVADSIFGPYTELENPWQGPTEWTGISFDSQSTFVLPIAGKPGSFIYMADRWRPKNPIDGRYVWVPVQWRENRPVLEWMDEWDLSRFGAREVKN